MSYVSHLNMVLISGVVHCMVELTALMLHLLYV